MKESPPRAMPELSASPPWQIQEPIRWSAILGAGFGVPALITFLVATSQHASYGFAIVLATLSFLFFRWDWQRHHTPPVFLRGVEVRILPDELVEGGVASCEIRVPASSRIKVRSWSFSVGIVELGEPVEDEEVPTLEGDVVSETRFSGEGNFGSPVADQVVFRCELLVPRFLKPTQSESTPLQADINIRLRLARWGTWRRYISMPVLLKPETRTAIS